MAGAAARPCGLGQGVGDARYRDQSAGGEVRLQVVAHPYGEKDQRLAWCGSGFGGQFPIIFPDLDMVVVLTGWNITGGGATPPHRDRSDARSCAA